MARILDRLSSVSLATRSRKGENSDCVTIIIITVDSVKSIIITHMLVKTI